MRDMTFEGVDLPWNFDALEALARWPIDRRVMLLHSGRPHSRWARWSILSEPAGTYTFDGQSRWRGPDGTINSSKLTDRPFSDLRYLQSATDAPWIGYLGYDVGRWIENLPSRAANDRDWPIIDLGWCPGYLVYDYVTQRWRACGTWGDGGYPDLDIAAPQVGQFTAGHLRSVFTREQYEQAVARVIDYIAAGDAFQVNLSQRLTADFDGTYPLAHRAAYRRLAQVSPAWYGAYLEPACESDHRVIASTSPELFLQVETDGTVTTRPIKGTRPAHVDPDELLHSEKDTAELNMIVDLLRNDLGRVCAYGTVRVSEPRQIESHPTVHHGVATVTGQLHEAQDVVDLLRATLPGGSITGAPKVRTMQIIEELEPVRRGPYCGSIGYLSRGEGCLNIAIRTMQIETPDGCDVGRVDFGVGGGVVADSDPASEYQETLDKAAAIATALDLVPGPFCTQDKLAQQLT